MRILAIDGVPVPGEEQQKPASTVQKIKALQAADEDLEWYPTTPEIMAAMEKDMWDYFRRYDATYEEECRAGIGIREDREYKDGEPVETERLYIDSFLDIGAGDGRVLDYFKAKRKYGIEIARTQADDLIRRGIFIIGRNYFDISLIDHKYALVFSNPPFSNFELWVNKLLVECNFSLLYLVIPVRWKDKEMITRELARYEAAVVGEFNFSKADREARGKVHLVRVNAPWKEKKKGDAFDFQEKTEDAFHRWVREYIADFKEEPELSWKDIETQALALKKTPIDQLVADYEREKENLRAAFHEIGKLSTEIIKMMGQDKRSMLEIIRKSIEGLKSKYWRAAFDKLEPVRLRMTKKTRDKIFAEINEFSTLDFNADNIYSIVIWIINNSNIGILDQICEVFDAMTDRKYISEYKSNRHWVKSDWRYTDADWKYKSLPPRWKLGLDYRIVVNAWGGATIIYDFIVICRNLGFPISPSCEPDMNWHGAEQKFYTEDQELAFTMRYYTGNRNAHLKINKKLLMKFNIEVAKIRKWMTSPDDVADEFDVPQAEAAQLWNSGAALLGGGDVKMLEFKGNSDG